MRVSKVPFVFIGGLVVAAGAVLSYKYIAGKRYRQRATAPKNETGETVSEEEDSLLDDMVLEDD